MKVVAGKHNVGLRQVLAPGATDLHTSIFMMWFTQKEGWPVGNKSLPRVLGQRNSGVWWRKTVSCVLYSFINQAFRVIISCEKNLFSQLLFGNFWVVGTQAIDISSPSLKNKIQSRRDEHSCHSFMTQSLYERTKKKLGYLGMDEVINISPSRALPQGHWETWLAVKTHEVKRALSWLCDINDFKRKPKLKNVKGLF